MSSFIDCFDTRDSKRMEHGSFVLSQDAGIGNLRAHLLVQNPGMVEKMRSLEWVI
jgi:hypothetical protein